MSKPPPIYAFADEEQALADAAAWGRLTAPSDAADFYRSWLAILCGQIERTAAGLLLLKQGAEATFAPAAVWPDTARDMAHLGLAAQRTLGDRRGLMLGPDGGSEPLAGEPAQLGCPIEVDGRLVGAVVLEVAADRTQTLERSLRLAQWAGAWLVDHFRRQQMAGLATATDLMAATLQDRRFGPSALAVVNEICARLRCDRVSLGVERRGNVEVKAISHTASFDRKSDLVRLIGQAMDEVIDLDVALAVPQAGSDDLSAIAHAEAARELRDVAICSVPLVDGGHAFGVITLERSSGQAFGTAEVELSKTLGLLLGPVFALKLHDERGPLERLRYGWQSGLRAAFGPRHPGVKLSAGVAALLLVFFTLFTTDYRVSANAVVEGEVQRAAAAPFDGFIAESLVRAGDTVSKGQVLMRLDERDLRLEQTRWVSERDQAERKYRVALAAQDRGTLAVLAAQVNQADAQLQLVEERLARSSIVAPFDGVVVSGDLSQLLGTPIEQGKVLFEVAPRDRFRVILKVDERDIAGLQLGQRGELLLSGLPGEAMAFSVKQLTPVSTAQDGRNYFRVEAALENTSARLRPGMEGVGKVRVGQERLIWIWTHGLTDWLRLTLWNWMP